VKRRAREMRNLYGRDPWRANGGFGRLRKPNPPTRLSANDESSTLLVAFGGMRGGFAIPLFEFSTLTEKMSVKRLYVRDLRQAWYHRGLTRRGKTLLDAA